MLNITRAKRMMKIFKQLEKLKLEGNKITDEIVALDWKHNSDEMQTSLWQNFHYCIDSIPNPKDDYSDVIELCDMVLDR